MSAKTKSARASSNLYLILDLGPGVSHSEILQAYNRSMRTYSTGSLASYSLIEDESQKPIIEEIEEAFAILGNPVKRREYDIKMGYETWKEDESLSKASRADLQPSIRTLDDDFEMPSQSRAAAVLNTQEGAPQQEKPQQQPAPEHKAQLFSLPSTQNPAYEPNLEFEEEIAQAEDIDGAFLRAVRVYRRLSVEQLAQRCKLQSSHVIAIEEEESEKLQHPVYLRGHVAMMAQILELPHAQTIATNYVSRMKKLGKSPNPHF